MIRYWKAQPETAKQIKKLLKEEDKWKIRVKDFAERVGSDTEKDFLISRGFGETSVAGLAFDQTPNPKLWKKIKNHDGYFQPKCRTLHHEEWESLKTDFIRQIADLVGMKIWMGFSIRTPGVKVKKGEVYLALPDDSLATGCDRITDIEYEAATQPKRKNTLETA